MNEDVVIQKLNSQEQQLDRIALKLTVYDERLEKIERQTAKLDMFDALMAGQDKMIGILERVDQERIFTNEKIKEMEADIRRIKLHLHLV